MKIILARHGNTFAPGARVYWVGKNEDLPLVESGVVQAKKLGEAFAKYGVRPGAVYSGPLQRTRNYAQIALETAGASTPIAIDARLNELDYGGWGGLSDDQIAARYGSEVLRGWTEKSIWPENCGWESSEDSILHEVRGFVQDVVSRHGDGQTVLVVSSNGRLRYFLELVAGEFSKRVAEKSFKMSTGNVSLLCLESTGFTIKFWNQAPTSLECLMHG